MSTIDIQKSLLDLLQDLRRLDLRLTRLAAALENPLFAADTDEPLNLEGALLGLITNTQQDEMASLIQLLNRAATLTSDDLKPEVMADPEPPAKAASHMATAGKRSKD